MDSGNSNSLLILVAMFDDYEKSVVAFYWARKANKTLSPFLSDLTPANLKKECKVVCEERYHKRDEWTLRAFFEQGGDKEACLQAIKRCDIDRFRPLINFLTGKARKTAETNIELLAWLIDFKRRPYDDKYDYKGDDSKDESDTSKDESNVSKDDTAIAEVENVKRSFIFGLREGIVVIALLAVIIGGIRFCTGRPNRPYASGLNGTGACMFWDVDHYERTPCIPRLGDTLVIALDSEKLNHFRLITRPDTITEAYKGKVWYVKFRGKTEFYTADGFHPIDQRLRLRPATVYMIRKYCHPDQ